MRQHGSTSGFHLPGLGARRGGASCSQQIGVPFQVLSVDVDESIARRGVALGLCLETRRGQGDARVWRAQPRCGRRAPVLAADTAVVHRRRDSWASPRMARCDAHARAAFRPHARGADRRCAAHRARHVQSRLSRSEVTLPRRSPPPRPATTGKRESPRTRPAAMPSKGTAAVFVADLRGQLFRRDGAAAVRDRRAAAVGGDAALAPAPSGAATMSTDILDQRQHARGARRRRRERRAAGSISRARQPARADQQHLQGPGLARAARHAGGLHRDRHGAHRVPARLGHLRSAPRGHRASSRRAPRTSARWSPKATRSWCRWSRIRWAPRARASPPTSRCRRGIWSTCRKGRGVGVSARIENETERERLRSAVLGRPRAGRERRIHRAHGRGGRAAGGACAPT